MLRAVVVVASVMLSACIFPGETCTKGGKFTEMEIDGFPPGAVASLALAGCSTCEHSKMIGSWDTGGFDGEQDVVTGSVEIQLSPQCFVRDTTVMIDPKSGIGAADNNFMNCGPLIDYAGYVTNRSDQNLGKMHVKLQCPTLDE